jgi:hypothetical protein
MSNWEPLEKYNYGDLMTVEEFENSVELGFLIDYDGYGYAVKDNLVDNSADIYPSEAELIPKWVTHIIWFNK